jgi:type I restriction enzyme S subunit
VRYLDHVDRRIRRYIRAKRRLLALLGEQKQAIIHQAVTRGLDPDVRLKPSGVAWLGDVPAHWEVKPLKHAFFSMDYGISASATDDGSIPLLTMGNIKDGNVSIPDSGGVESVDEHFLLNKGDLLFNRTNSAELVGKVGLLRSDHWTKVTFASYLVRLRPRPENDPEYLNFLLNSPSILGIARQLAVPSLHQSNLNPTRYGRIQVALPQLIEQQHILNHLSKSSKELDRVVATTNREINLLREYRTRLIADVVTGQVDVRAAAANLPADAGEVDETVEDGALAAEDEIVEDGEALAFDGEEQ